MENEKPKLIEDDEKTNDNSENAAVEDEETIVKDKESKIISSADSAIQQVVSSNHAEESTEKLEDEISSTDALALYFAEMHISTDPAESEKDKKSSSDTDKPSAGQEVATNTGQSLENAIDDPKVEMEEPSVVNKMKKPVYILPKRNKVFDFAKMVPDSESDSNSDY